MTDGRNVLEIFGTAEDKVSLSQGWGTAVNDGNGYDVYTATVGADTITLKVYDDIIV